ncbi:MAG: nuclear transport factor 2 family protein [Pseudomonadota bacterium]|nr:nuclear transport factor 2 family protein [Pseudomonadota bacterium]
MQTRLHIRSALTLMVSFALGISLLGLSSMAALAEDASDRLAIESTAQRWTKAFNDRDAAALAALVTEDVIVLDGGKSPIAGPARAADAWLRAAALSQGGIESTDKEIVISGDVAWRVGVVAYSHSGGASIQGQSLEIWKRTRNGWKLHRQMSSQLMERTLRPAPSEPVLGRPTN